MKVLGWVELALCILAWIVWPATPSSLTGFWYSGDRPPFTLYDTVPYVSLSVKIAQPYQDGPGTNLIRDPLNVQNLLFSGLTISRQTFDTQFVLDMSYVLGIDMTRVYVNNVQRGNVHFSWESSSVIVSFYFLERNSTDQDTLLTYIAQLTNLIQIPSSKLYERSRVNVTYGIDPTYGLKVEGWDVSLRLTYAIEVVGGKAVIDGYYLNQGGRGICDVEGAANFTQYCEFERFFEDDVSRALNITSYRVQIQFIRKAAFDSVLIFFRIQPSYPRFVVKGGFFTEEQTATEQASVSQAVLDLIGLTYRYNSSLYAGNVTIRVDPVWGVSNNMEGAYTPSTRKQEALFTYSYYEMDPSRLNNPIRATLTTDYDRCKANHRCNWGVVFQNQTTNDVRYFQQLFDRGNKYGINLFLDFEDWRLGTRGFNWEGTLPPIQAGQVSVPRARALELKYIRGAHFWPFDQPSLGPVVPCYLQEENHGLVLNRDLQRRQIDQQEALVSDLEGRIDFLQNNIETAFMDASRRSRKDVRRNLTWVKDDFNNWYLNERKELTQLSSSMCVNVSSCTLIFDTTALTLTGAIGNWNGTIRTTAAGTQVAVWSFDSIYLGPEVGVTLIGQRAFSLVSKTNAVINTTFYAAPGTIGGMQGGGSVGRFLSDSLETDVKDIYICDIGGYCNENLEDRYGVAEAFVSNNVNGPGSGNLRVTAFVVTTSATDLREIQVIKTSAQTGQTLSGGFQLLFKNYETPIIPHDCSSQQLKQILENNLNVVPPTNAPINPNRLTDGVAGVGLVNVSRSTQTDEEGYTWSITFTTAIGNIEQMQYVNYLQGLEAKMSITTFRDGNELLGSFTLSYQGTTTRPIAANETAAEFQAKLESLPMVTTAAVLRIDPTRNCDDGLCPNGPLPARGMIWTCYVTTNYTYDDVTPTSPTSKLISVEAPFFRFTAQYQDTLVATGARVDISFGTSKSQNVEMQQLTITSPFSLAYGGAGASYGGLGGAGYSANPVALPYNDRGLTDLIGGSGGCMRGVNAFEINSIRGRATAWGGHGGGAIEIVAANDIEVGSYGRIIVRGGDAGQSSQGGGGGGSGGALLLAAGGSIINDGVIDISGGDGGYGGSLHPDMAGGGGGGGRIAIYAQSFIQNSTLSVQGGRCGAYKIAVPEFTLLFNVTIHVYKQLPLDPGRTSYLSAVMINNTVGTDLVRGINELAYYENKTSSVSSLTFNVQVYDPAMLAANQNGTNKGYNSSYLASLQGKFRTIISGDGSNNNKSTVAGYELAQLTFLQAAIDTNSAASRTLQKVRSTFPLPCTNNGGSGSYFTQTTMTTKMYVRETVGAEKTKRALYFSNNELTNTTSGSPREAPFPANGPIIAFEASRPTRVTYYTKLGYVPGVSTKRNYGALFTLLSRGEAALDVSNVIGVFIGQTIMHGANFGTSVDEKAFLKRLVTIFDYPSVEKWYKIDIKIQWIPAGGGTYSVSVDDAVVASGQPFSGDDVDGIRLSVMNACDVWYDEIYVGFDNSMSFTCPVTSRDKGTVTMSPPQKHWNLEEVSGPGSAFTLYKDMARHYSHLDPTGSVPFDGQGAVTSSQDIKFKYETGDYPITQGKLHAGALNYLTGTGRSAKTASGRSATTVSPLGGWYAPPDGIGGAGDGRQFWYTEYNFVSDFAASLNGGVMACSSQDLLSWRFEGVVFHYTNLSDMVYGSQGPFALERPKVKYNLGTKTFIMWAVMDNERRSLAMSLVATSKYEDGPFYFKRSFYPDGNQTRDQVIFQLEENGVTKSVLARTYYATVEFLLPQTIMQPVWESVKNRDGTVNYRSNYLRGKYDIGYDNLHDIFYQRWRSEDKDWNVVCKDRLTGAVRQVKSSEFTKQGDGYSKTDYGTICLDPQEEKITTGQGGVGGIGTSVTLFTGPDNPDNSWWTQSSVPAVNAQPWSSSYRDGYCGIRQLDDYLYMFDPSLATFQTQNRANCSNIVDNPMHETLPDKFIGVQRVVATRRAKFMALSELTDDLMDTTGNLNAFEGELDSGDLISMIIEMGQFGFAAGTEVKSTFVPPIRSEFDTARDYKYRFYQYIFANNDRASYSMACIVDGICPNNFKSKLTVGNT